MLAHEGVNEARRLVWLTVGSLFTDKQRAWRSTQSWWGAQSSTAIKQQEAYWRSSAWRPLRALRWRRVMTMYGGRGWTGLVRVTCCLDNETRSVYLDVL